MQPAVGGDGGVPKFRLEMARHQERVAQSSAGHVGCPDGTRAAERPHRAHGGRSGSSRRLYANADARSSVVVAAQMSAADGDRAMLNGLHQVYGAATRRAVVRMITEAADGVLELLATRG